MSPEVPLRPATPPEQTGWPGVNHAVIEENGLRIERDAPVTMRDGTTLRVDIFRPLDAVGPLPALLAWSPYGKHGNVPWNTPLFAGLNLGFDPSELSGYTPFEYPDPAWWAGNGYAVVYADIRGTWGSEGDAVHWSQQEAEDGYDTIEWIAAQPWSNGRVGMSGCSNLAWTQWYIAAAQPPSLAAINPWEGVSDHYREFLFHGGIPETNFTAVWQALAGFGRQRTEDLATAIAAHPTYDEYWEAKDADLSKVTVPAFVVASWSDHGLHTRGSLEGYRRISSEHKWLHVHGGKKWAAMYSPENLQRQLDFFDKFVKQVASTDVDQWPPVRIEVRESLGVGQFRDEEQWPLARTTYEKLFLTQTSKLELEPASTGGDVSYDAQGGSAHFDIVFDEPAEITGYMSLRLQFTADGADDADLFVAIQKLDRNGDLVPFDFFSVQEDGNVALGWLRASHRELDLQASTPEQPVLTHRSPSPLPAEGSTSLDIEILASSTQFAAGEGLRLLVQGRDVNSYPAMTPTDAHTQLVNAGTHVIHTGGGASYLLIPRVS